MKKVIIIEDETIVALELRQYVASLGFEVVATAHTKCSAIEAIEESGADICLLDINIEGNFEGIELSRIINTHFAYMEIIFITAYTDAYILDAISRIQYSAYIIKPFRREELDVALQLAARKRDLAQPVLVLLPHGYRFDITRGVLFLQEKSIDLTQHERALLLLLSTHLGQVVPYDVIEVHVWNSKEVTPNSLRNLIYKINKKTDEKLIRSKSGMGYFMERI